MGEHPQRDRRIGRIVRLHESTVQAAASGAHRGRARRKPSTTSGGIAAELTYSIKVRRDVWSRALELAADPRFIQIVSKEEVIVWNHAPPWPK